MLEAIWTAAAVLPEEKQARLKGPFLETVTLAGDEALTASWAARLDTSPPAGRKTTPYAQQKAEAVLAEDGWDEFIRKAGAQSAPFNIGRPEIMAAGARLAPDEPARSRVVAEMFRLAGTPQAGKGLDRNFEQADFGHVLAELAMEACDLAAFDRALALTSSPESLRYALWRARITGEVTELAVRIRNEADEADTRHVRAALEGYAPILSQGVCP